MLGSLLAVSLKAVLCILINAPRARTCVPPDLGLRIGTSRIDTDGRDDPTGPREQGHSHGTQERRYMCRATSVSDIACGCTFCFLDPHNPWLQGSGPYAQGFLYQRRTCTLTQHSWTCAMASSLTLSQKRKLRERRSGHAPASARRDASVTGCLHPPKSSERILGQ